MTWSPPPPQGLKAFLLSSPYDCPPWAPEVLMALVPAAGGGRQPAAVRSEAAQALSEFKRTHEQVSLAARPRTTSLHVVQVRLAVRPVLHVVHTMSRKLSPPPHTPGSCCHHPHHPPLGDL